jgi:hypothetical protein
MQYGLPLSARNWHLVFGGQSPAYYNHSSQDRALSDFEYLGILTTHTPVTSHTCQPSAPVVGFFAHPYVAGLQVSLAAVSAGAASAAATRERRTKGFIVDIRVVNFKGKNRLEDSLE